MEASTGISQIQIDQNRSRILSIDFFRGFVMFILVTGIGRLFSEMAQAGKGGEIIAFINRQCDHGVWYEMYFWDLIQPFFMFIVGVAMPFSFSKRIDKGETWKQSLWHVLKRSFWLLVLGFMLGAKKDAYYLTNILPQLSFVYLVAFLLMRLQVKWQLIISFILILISDLLYNFWPVEGFNQLAPGHNFGSWLDSVTTGHLHPYNWVTFNAIPTSAHTIWGVCAGYLLMSDWSQRKKMLTLLITGTIGVIIGYSMRPFIPIIEHISTSSFMIVSGGWCLVTMAVSYFLVDILKFEKFAKFFAIMGMNPIFIYIFSMLGGTELLSRMVVPFTSRIFNWCDPLAVNMITILVVVAMMWYISYFLYKRKIFLKL
jgi:predicted acyltransferase